MNPGEMAKGLFDASTEREFFLLVLGVLTGGGLIFALSWKGLSVFRDLFLRMMDSLDRDKES